MRHPLDFALCLFLQSVPQGLWARQQADSPVCYNQTLHNIIFEYYLFVNVHIPKMPLYSSDYIEDLLTEKPIQSFALQSDEIRVIERLHHQTSQRKISFPSRMNSIDENENETSLHNVQNDI